MLRTRWLVIAALLGVAILGSVIDARGPFAAHSSISYPQFLADFEAGRVQEITQWRDRLEITEGPELLLVTVPAGVSLMDDLGQARLRGGIGINLSTIPDAWLSSFTPLIPALLLVVGLVLWLPALLRRRPQGAIPPGEPALP